MEDNSMVSGKMIKWLIMAYTLGPMEKSSKATIRTIKEMGKAVLNIVMVMFMLGTGRIIKKMDKER